MGLRFALYPATAGSAQPERLHFWLPRVIGVLAAALAGLGVILWVAANWDVLGRTGRFALLMGTVALAGTGAAWRPRARIPLALLALFGMGGLFAYFGQTYQTGADAWQLFALWAVLALPLCLGARSDAVWVPWTVVAFTAVTLWTHTHLGHRWQANRGDLAVHGVAWLAMLGVVLLLGRGTQRHTGAGLWSLRTAVLLAVSSITFAALLALFTSPIRVHYGLGLLLLVAAAVWFARHRSFDVFALSAVALGLVTLLTAGLARMVLREGRIEHAGALLLVGLVAAGLLTAAVSAVMRLLNRHAEQEARDA